MILTYPSRVNIYTIADLTSRVRRGPKCYPGARYIIMEDNSMIDLDGPDRHTIELKPGMIVERHLIDGDYVLLNRQPTLHKPSIMAHRVKINPDPRALSWQMHIVSGSYFV